VLYDLTINHDTLRLIFSHHLLLYEDFKHHSLRTQHFSVSLFLSPCKFGMTWHCGNDFSLFIFFCKGQVCQTSIQISSPFTSRKVWAKAPVEHD